VRIPLRAGQTDAARNLIERIDNLVIGGDGSLTAPTFSDKNGRPVGWRAADRWCGAGSIRGNHCGWSARLIVSGTDMTIGADAPPHHRGVDAITPRLPIPAYVVVQGNGAQLPLSQL
jgi:hypothetical protein